MNVQIYYGLFLKPDSVGHEITVSILPFGAGFYATSSANFTNWPRNF